VPPAPARVAKLVEVARATMPVALVAAPDGRLFVVEKVGRVRLVERGRLSAPVVDVSRRVSSWTEEGLLGLALHPKFIQNGRLYINFTDIRGDTRVVELRLGPKAAAVDPASERELLFVRQPYVNHNGGDLVFGPDGLLYIGLGDGGSANDPHGNGQNRQTLLGKMLRLDVDASVPRPEILHMGLRNPWRYAFDRKTGDLYIADVGQDRYEEVNVVPAGAGPQNFGWNVVEGLHCLRRGPCDPTGMTPPVLEYTHKSGCSIIGGFVYRGRALPELDGIYFYGDYCTAGLWGFRYRDGQVVDSWDWKPVLDPDSRLATLSSFGEDADGELYLLSLDGPIYKMVRR
jgi:glucose/arabinose dehydrogenase